MIGERVGVGIEELVELRVVACGRARVELADRHSDDELAGVGGGEDLLLGVSGDADHRGAGQPCRVRAAGEPGVVEPRRPERSAHGRRTERDDVEVTLLEPSMVLAEHRRGGCTIVGVRLDDPRAGLDGHERKEDPDQEPRVAPGAKVVPRAAVVGGVRLREHLGLVVVVGDGHVVSQNWK